MESSTGTLVSVNISVAKGTPKVPVATADVDEKGIVTDAHAGPWHRQVSLLSAESMARFSAEEGRTFQPGDFAENLTVQGIYLSEVSVLGRFRSGSVELEVTQLGKRCHGDGCAIFQTAGKCVMPKEGLFCRVLSTGTLRPGDTIEYIPRPLRFLVITLSDRASRGDYEDHSGPRAVQCLEQFFASKRWTVEIETRILPDDADKLRAALIEARESGIDAVFTSGGTGIGPRDITPDVVLRLADKTLPGIMEHIRQKYGQEKPAALLSRSVAAVLGGTLVYTLPGSPRAVEEYLEEILKTLEHIICTLHEIDAH